MDKRPCKKCLLKEASEIDYQKLIADHLASLKSSDLVEEDIVDARLEVCKTCEKLNMGTCLSCGCYVEIRAALKNGRCPNKKWK